jgi:hypothetical protein
VKQRYLLLGLALSLTGCVEAMWRVDPATPPRRWRNDPRVRTWPRPLNITYTFWTGGRVSADVSPANQWWRQIHGTGWEIDTTSDPDDVDTIVFDGIVERYRRHYPDGEAILTMIPSARRKRLSDQ